MEQPIIKKKIVIKKVVSDDKNVKKKTEPLKTKKKVTKTKKNKDFPKEGQTKPTPSDKDPLMKFYTSLLKQKPNSEMAIKWCTEHGLFPDQPDNIVISMGKLGI